MPKNQLKPSVEFEVDAINHGVKIEAYQYDNVFCQRVFHAIDQENHNILWVIAHFKSFNVMHARFACTCGVPPQEDQETVYVGFPSDLNKVTLRNVKTNE